MIHPLTSLECVMPMVTVPRPRVAARAVAVIDDSLVMRAIVTVCLQREGFTVQAFADGVEALRAFNLGTAPLPGLILLDLGLPRLDGYEVARLLKRRERLAAIPLVMLSERDGICDRLKGRLVGAQAYLSKPFRTQQLVALVRETLRGQWQEEQEHAAEAQPACQAGS